MNLLEIVNAGILRQLSNRLVAVKTEVTNQFEPPRVSWRVFYL
ncbi:Uncharacterised protein [Escherichia coli]|uniref:Uncharacterized protein n=1 Tax=Escherichia coli TaxID=562 RepID=A0A376M6H7_ECOLX|nr:Uncharacterised protein [Escherichia coli]